MTPITSVNYYRSNEEWCYAAFSGSEMDHSDAVGVPDDASATDVEAELAELFPGATIRRVDDVTI